ncbi:chromosome transmission fidelity protein 8 homolog [Orussus abietinus]|uniref:chromosome transmission fidelity protein 8 homolog n=1 Tax=Orussus abietinus TaxID=222816 RepID=UPI0006252510|nr:chromosome transmission fidelity protein 8 homolog [Orussus abietinus]
MFVPVKRDGQLTEWAMIELQGELKNATIDSTSNTFIGDLHFTKAGIPVLIIGIHILYGKEIKLDKPIAVLQKSRYDKHGNPISEEFPADDYKTEYVIKAVVKKKLVFKGRPKPIVTNVPKPV